MKLVNKKTGEIVRVEFLNNWQTDDGTEIGFRECNSNIVYSYNSLAELNEEWEDYEEPKEYWYIDFNGEIKEFELLGYDWQGWMREIGNYFETREEAEKAVEKLKAWKRLKDKEFEFVGCFKDNTINFEFVGHPLSYDEAEEAEKDIALLFGGEE